MTPFRCGDLLLSLPSTSSQPPRQGVSLLLGLYLTQSDSSIPPLRGVGLTLGGSLSTLLEHLSVFVSFDILSSLLYDNMYKLIIKPRCACPVHV